MSLPSAFVEQTEVPFQGASWERQPSESRRIADGGVMVMVTRVDRDSEGNAAWCMHEQGGLAPAARLPPWDLLSIRPDPLQRLNDIRE
jgi:hypothetical protein